MASLWDPLENVRQTSDELVSATRKREIQNILKSYVGFYDPFSEIIQNAMDAVDVRRKKLKEQNYVGKLWIEINLKENYFSVTDNGIGFKQEEFRTFLCPNMSFKSGKGTRGKKGVGATYLAYGFNFLQLGTKTPDYSIVAEIKDGRPWVEDQQGIVTRPHVSESVLIHKVFSVIDRGSTFTLRFGGENTRPKDLSWISARTADQWKTVLLVKTPLGNVDIEASTTDAIRFDIKVIDEEGIESSLSDQIASYVFPHKVISASASFHDILEEQARRMKRHQDPSKLPDKFRQLNGVYGIWKTDDLVKLLGPKSDDIELIQRYAISAYGYFCYTTRIWDQYNDSVVKLRKGNRILRGGLQLATDCMPQGDLLTIPLTSTIGYQHQTHIVIHFSNADPDLGRKGFQPELRDVAYNISVALVNMLKKWRHLLRKDTGGQPSIVDEGKLHHWIQQQEQYEATHPLRITNPHFFLPLKEISINSEPRSEQDVIVLFNQLIAGGVIRGIKLLATSQHEQYDSIIRYYVREPLANYVFNKETNPLGVNDLAHHAAYTSKPYVLEYKYTIDGLIQDFENGEKSERDINLVVAWQIGEEWKKRYSVTSFLDLDNLQHRQFHGLTHSFSDENSGDLRFYAIILSELIQYLNDVDAVQEYHRVTYSGLV